MSGLPDSIVRRPEVNGNEPEIDPPSFLERGRIRRRARYLRRLREVQLRDLGGFLVELRRFAAERPEVVQEKLEEAARTDDELRRLEGALGAEHPLRELREPGLGGACAKCGAIHGSADRFCSACGHPLGPSRPPRRRELTQ
jgi:hypothetical protein